MMKFFIRNNVNFTRLLLFFITIVCTILELFYGYEICESISIQGTLSRDEIETTNKIYGKCDIIIGHVRILNANLSDQITFTNLIEVSDYILVFQALNVSSLEKIFPKLTLIRGNKQFMNFALIIFLVPTLKNIDLSNLLTIKQGGIFISRLYNSCYINTVDWNYLISHELAVKNHSIITLNNNNNCLLEERCNKSCTKCWNSDKCQLFCPLECKYNCDIKTGSCCKNENCLHCTSDNKCLACSKYYDLTNGGNCVKECPIGTLVYESHSCIAFSNCTLSSKFIDARKFHVLNDRYCVRECPNGYESVVMSSHNSTEMTKPLIYRKCELCEKSKCNKQCNIEFYLKTQSDLEMIRKCVIVKSITIEINKNVDLDLLTDNLKNVEEIEDYLLIINNNYVTTLNFFKNLRLIHGKSLYAKKYALFIYNNELLREIFDYKLTNFTILNGDLFILSNPELCYSDIKQFIMQMNAKRNDTNVYNYVDIMFRFNGFKRLTCSNNKIELKFSFQANKIIVRWNASYSDLRRLKGFTLAYISAPFNKTYDPNSLFINDSWSIVYVKIDKTQLNFLKTLNISTSILVEPFTRYAIYVKADIEFNQFTLFDEDAFNSDIYYVYSLPSRPDHVQKVNYKWIENNKLDLEWNSPNKPNGVIQYYIIAYSPIEDVFTLPNNTFDLCQYVPNNKELSGFNSMVEYNNNKIVKDNSSKNILDDVSDDKDVSDYAILVEDAIYNIGLNKLNKKDRNNQAYEKENERFVRSDMISLDTNQTMLNSYFVHNLNIIKESLLNMLKSDFEKTTHNIELIIVNNHSFQVLLDNLDTYDKYLFAVVACQDFTHELLHYTSSFDKLSRTEMKNFSLYLSEFKVSDYCSKSSMINIYRPATNFMNEISETHVTSESGNTYLRWSKPKQSHGLIYRYNIRFTDTVSNKTYGPLCHVTLDKLSIPLNNLLLTEGKEYYIQVQAVSTLGEGEWSKPLKYLVKNEKFKYYYELIGGILAGMVIFIVVVSIVGYGLCLKYIKSDNKEYFTINKHYLCWKPDKWEIERDKVELFERIGSGCFGEVFKGKVTLTNNETVDCAVKLPTPNKKGIDKIVSEATTLQRINAPHIIKLLAVVSIGDPLYLVLEYMEKGDLKNYLHKHRPHQELCDDTLTNERLYRIAAEIADGMLWLSEHRYVHCDLAARNCLISANDVVKVADLGLCKDTYVDPVYYKKNKALLPIRWMAVESLVEGAFTTMSDIWSYGVVIWELCTYADHPYAGKENDEVIKYVKSGGKLVAPMNSPPKFFYIIEKCMMRDPFERLSFKDILDILENDLNDDFKKTSFYNNEFKIKRENKNMQLKYSVNETNNQMDKLLKNSSDDDDHDNKVNQELDNYLCNSSITHDLNDVSKSSATEIVPFIGN